MRRIGRYASRRDGPDSLNVKLPLRKIAESTLLLALLLAMAGVFTIAWPCACMLAAAFVLTGRVVTIILHHRRTPLARAPLPHGGNVQRLQNTREAEEL